MKGRRIVGRLILALVTPWVLFLLFAYPFFALIRPSGATVLVTEGWMQPAGIQAAADLFREGGYEKLYVTGTLRPFAYHLEFGDTLEVILNEAFYGGMRLAIAGLPGTTWTLLADEGSIGHGVADPQLTEFSIAIGAPITQLRMTPSMDQPPGEGIPALFIGTLLLNDADPHVLHHEVRILRANGDLEEGRPTFAEEGAAQLREAGVPAESVIAVPTRTASERTRSAARNFADFAAHNDIGGYDVATPGVHARRTWTEHARASAPIPVGVVALNDPACGRWNWWLTPRGWTQMLKEVAALPSMYM